MDLVAHTHTHTDAQAQVFTSIPNINFNLNKFEQIYYCSYLHLYALSRLLANDDDISPFYGLNIRRCIICQCIGCIIFGFIEYYVNFNSVIFRFEKKWHAYMYHLLFTASHNGLCLRYVWDVLVLLLRPVRKMFVVN